MGKGERTHAAPPVAKESSDSLTAGLGRKLRFALTVRFREAAPEVFGVAIGGVHRCPGLLAPRLVKGTVVDRVKPEIVDQRHDLCFGAEIVAGDRQRDTVFRSGGASILEQMFGVDVIERLDDRAADLFCNPAALGNSILNRLDPRCWG